MLVLISNFRSVLIEILTKSRWTLKTGNTAHIWFEGQTRM